MASHNRLSLIDAEILRCKSEMERVLVGGGEGVMLMGRNRGGKQSPNINLKVNRDEIRWLDPDEKWKRILVSVANELKSMTPDPRVKELYLAVLVQIDAAVKGLAKLDVSREWKKIGVAFRRSHDNFELIRFGTSVLGTGKHSIFHLFNVLSTGLVINSEDWMRYEQKNNAQKNSQILEILRRIGEGLQELDTENYYGYAVGGDAPRHMRSIYDILQGRTVSKPEISEPDDDGDDLDWEKGDSDSNSKSRDSDKDDWKKRLISVFKLVGDLRATSVSERMFNGVKKAMRESVEKIATVDLSDNVKWGKLRSHLNTRRDFFYGLSIAAGSGRPVFTALYEGLSIEKEEWVAAKDLTSRNAIMNSLLQELGEKLNEVDDKAYDSILERGGANTMRKIAKTLQGIGQ